MGNKKKLLILIEWFKPGYKAGGPIQSCVNICVALKDRYNIYVLTTDTDHGETSAYEDVVTNQWAFQQDVGVMVYYAQKKTASFKQFEREIKHVNAEYLYLNLLFSPKFVLFPLWLKYRTKIKSEVVLCPRGTLYDSALSLRWYKKKPLLSLLKAVGIHKKVLFHATNEREKNSIEKYFPGSKIVIADNLPDILQTAFSGHPKIAGSLQCIFIARIVPIKNLLFLLQLLADVQQMVTLTIVGPAENEAYWEACKKAIDELPQRIKVTYEGAKKNDQLLALLQQHHLFVLPTTGENFGHSIFESFLAGRPVLISDQTPWLNLPQSNAGWDLPLNQKSVFVNALEKAAAWNQQEFDASAQAAWLYANNFINNPSLIKPYYQLFP